MRNHQLRRQAWLNPSEKSFYRSLSGQDESHPTCQEIQLLVKTI